MKLKLTEFMDGAVQLVEAAGNGDGGRRIKAIGITADVVNGNNRRYPAAVLSAAVTELKAHLRESAGQGRLLGEAEHPNDKPSGRASLLETVVKWESVEFDGRQVLLEGRILETSKGKDILAVLAGGVLPGVSQRGYGLTRSVGGGPDRVDEVTELHITGYDLVMEPSDPYGTVTMLENKNQLLDDKEFFTMDELDLNKLREKYPDLVAQIEREHDDKRRRNLEEALKAKQADDERGKKLLAEREKDMRAALGLNETDDLQQALADRQNRLNALEEAEKKRQVAAYIDKEAEGVRYPAWLKGQFMEAVKAAVPATVDEAKQTLIAKRKEYDAIMAGLELAAKGFGGVQVLGPVLERETGVPEFARAAFEIGEALRHTGLSARRDLRQPKTINERVAAEYLKRFDDRYKGNLQREAQMFAEAETTSDLSLPYSVSRAVVAEVWPTLVATSVLDVGMTEVSPMYIYYEDYAGESGATASITNEAVVMTAVSTWYSLAHNYVQPGTVVVQDATDTTTYVEGTNYVVDYINGKIMSISGISAGATIHVDYSYDAVGKGEMAAIERAKIQLSSQVLTCSAARLAAQISREALVFSRSQLGWDATTRTLMSLVQQIRRLIDRGLFYSALSAALQVASNSGGTWTSASDSLTDLVEKVGVARVKVANRYYQPTGIVMSVTNSDRIANWDGFTSAGSRSDATMDGNGFVGRLKGLPVYETTEFTDSYVLVVNREVVMHRVLDPMVMRGPYPTYDSGKLVAAEQYYAEEFNGTITPVPQKAAYVKIA